MDEMSVWLDDGIIFRGRPEKPYLKKNEMCLLSPNFKLASIYIYIDINEKETLYFYYTK
jgi:hypothetical protein